MILQALLNQDDSQLSVQLANLQWEKFKRKQNGFHISSLKAKCTAKNNNGT